MKDIMRAYSQDLRDRVISHYNTGEYQIKDLAKMFDMTRQTIGSWIKRYKETGDYSSRQHLSKGREIRFNDRAKVLEYGYISITRVKLFFTLIALCKKSSGVRFFRVSTALHQPRYLCKYFVETP